MNEPKFVPWVRPEETKPEFTLRAIILGGLFGILFGAITVYVGLRGLTIGASIPIAVLSIFILRALGKVSILENNIVQTAGSAGESVAGGVIFTLPALIFLGFELEFTRIVLLALIGGFLGVLFMIPFRRQLIVKEHTKLLYPEATACADVLIAGDRGGAVANRVAWGLGLGAFYTFFQNENIFRAWPGTPTYSPAWLPGASVSATTAPEYLGVGYIIGPRIAGVMLSGSIFASLFIMPAVTIFDSGHINRTLEDLRNIYIGPIGVGAVATAGLITLLRTIPTIVTLTRIRLRALATNGILRRTDKDISIMSAIPGICILIFLMALMLIFHPVPGASSSVFHNIIASVLVIIFGFLFVSVSSRTTGLIGSSSNPISGMAIATLMATCTMFRVAHWIDPASFALALSIGGVVCIAAANGGNTAQSLKTGFLVGATPANQQLALLIGVTGSIFAIGITLAAINWGLEEFRPVTIMSKVTHQEIKIDLAKLPDGISIDANSGFDRDRVHIVTSASGAEHATTELKSVKDMVLLNVINSPEIPNGQYFFNLKTGHVEIQWIQGIGSANFSAPQARLMATVINGILTNKLSLQLVMLGVFMVIGIELLGISSLPFAVGFYIPIATTLAIFCGGLVRWLVDWQTARKGDKTDEADISPGSLYASGLIAAGGIVGLIGIGFKVMETQGWVSKNFISLGSRSPFLAEAHWLSLASFMILAFSLFHYARKPLETELIQDIGTN